MKKTLTLLTVIIGIVLFTSCTSIKSSSVSTMGIIKTGVVQNTLIVDLEVKETKVTGTSMGKVTASSSVQQEAIANALKGSKADVLVEPIYSTVSSRGTITVTVTGFPGYYKNFRPLTKKDLAVIKAGRAQEAKVSIPKK